MKVLGIVCSPRKNGNTEIMIRTALDGARSYGAEIDLWTTAGKILNPCDACRSGIEKGGQCHINDDLQELYPKVLSADGIIFGTPAYFESASAQAKIVIDRLYCLYNLFVLANKVAGVITVAASSGNEGAYAVFQNFVRSSHMLAADHAYGFARSKGEVRRDKFAMKASEELGKQVVLLIKQSFRWPEEFKKPLYRVCKDNYDISAYPLRNQKPDKSRGSKGEDYVLK